ncbi:MAG: HAMP domain-containing histidine kinase [Lachnospiraceae bacterium]|nr:HAMP domain-containing histidine kinase [Lachnospiraceae bacterium]
MLKRMRRRFILASMAAFGTVMAVLTAGINLVNYYRTTSMQDEMARVLLEREVGAMQRPQAPLPPMADLPGGGPEAEFTVRFFAAHCDLGGNVLFIARDHISSIDRELAAAYTQDVLAGEKTKGYYKDYRYLVRRDGRGITVLFLNAAHSLQSVRSLLLVSLGTGTGSLLLVFFLVLYFSGHAVRPFAENMERQKRFITDAGHELKTPITSIAASADIAAMAYEGDEWIENIKKQTLRLGKLVNDLVALSRLDEENPFRERSDFSLSDAAWEAAEPFAVLAKAKGKSYCQKIEENLTFCGDRNSVLQLISILLDNAVKYSGENGEISLEICRKRGKIWIRVENTCQLPGIPDLDRLFDRFYRVDESRSAATGGTGIGLSMARAIAQAHGGRIEAVSPGGDRLLMKVCLPDKNF